MGIHHYNLLYDMNKVLFKAVNKVIEGTKPTFI